MSSFSFKSEILSLAPPAFANFMPSSLQINPTLSGMEKPLGLEGSFLGQGWRSGWQRREIFFSSPRMKKISFTERTRPYLRPSRLYIPIQAGLPRLQKDPPVQRACLTCNQTEAQGLRVRTKQPSHQSASASRIRVGALGVAGDGTTQERGPPLAPL